MAAATPFVLQQGLETLDDPLLSLRRRCRRRHRRPEHVFPKWLLKRFDLWNEPLTLLNGTVIKYRQARHPLLPALRTTSTSPALRIASKQPSRSAPVPWWSCQPGSILWMVKIYYGLLFRNLTLPVDQTNSAAGPIVTPDDLSRFRFLPPDAPRAARHQGQHASRWHAWVVRDNAPAQTSTSGHASLNWDYLNIPHVPFLALRVGEVALFTGLEDFGAFVHFARETKRLDAAQHLKGTSRPNFGLQVLFAAIAMWGKLQQELRSPTSRIVEATHHV